MTSRANALVDPSYTVLLEPVADAEVRSTEANTNFGTATQWQVDRATRQTYLRFDLRSLPANATVTAVTLSATAFEGYAYGGDGNVYTTFVPTDTWGETTLTWNNRPATSGDPVGDWFLWYNSTPALKLGSTSNAALIPLVQSELSGDGQISFRLHSPGYRTSYYSREVTDATRRPHLAVTFTVPDAVAVLEPEADSFVEAWSGADNNHGGDTGLTVYRGNEAYLRFNLASLPAGTTIKSVKLSATAFTGFANGGDPNTYTYFVPDNTWGEYTLTGNNRPLPSGDPVGSWLLWYNHELVDKVGTNTDPGLVPLVQSASDASDRRITFQIHSPEYTTNYYSREVTDSTKRPKLEVTYTRPLTLVLTPTADAYVDLNAPAANAGTTTSTTVELGTLRTYLRFELPRVQNAQLASASLTLTAFAGYAHGGDGNVYTTFVPNDTWGETTLTWNNRPATSGSALGSWFLWYDSTPVEKVGTFSSASLLSVVQTEMNGDGKVSFELNSPGYRTQYWTREYADASRRPRLELTFQ